MSILDIQAKKNQEKITMLTAYDYPTARVVDQSGIDMILVGDSLGNVILGHPDTLQVTLQNMIHHTRAVVTGSSHALVVADMPFGTYQASIDDAVHHATQLIGKGGAQAVKLEGGKPVVETIQRLVDVGIPVMGHLGLTPQSVNQLGGFKVQGKTTDSAQKILQDAKALEEAGCFSIVLECIPAELAQTITQTLTIPTIGIGCGVKTDGQVLVFHDLVGFTDQKTPSFVRPVAQLHDQLKSYVSQYIHRTKEEG